MLKTWMGTATTVNWRPVYVATCPANNSRYSRDSRSGEISASTRALGIVATVLTGCFGAVSVPLRENVGAGCHARAILERHLAHRRVPDLVAVAAAVRGRRLPRRRHMEGGHPVAASVRITGAVGARGARRV